MQAHLGRLEDERPACRETRGYQVLDHLGLPIDHDPAGPSAPRSRAGELAVEPQVDAVVDESFAVEALREAVLAEEVDDALLEDAGAQAALDIFPRATLQNDGVDSRRVQRCPNTRPAGPAPTIATCVRDAVTATVEPPPVRAVTPARPRRARLGDAKRRVRRRHAAIDGALQEYLADLVGRESIASRGAHVQRDSW